MSVLQLGNGFHGSSTEQGNDYVLGIMAQLAYDPDIQVFGWMSFGDHTHHVRRYRKLIKSSDIVFSFWDDDGVYYQFSRRLIPVNKKWWEDIQKLIAASKIASDSIFPEDLMTLQMAAQQMGFKIVPEPWCKPGEWQKYLDGLV